MEKPEIIKCTDCENTVEKSNVETAGWFINDDGKCYCQECIWSEKEHD